MPWEWLELRLCRDVYHCRPSELAEEEWATISLHLKLMEADAEMERAKQQPGLTGAAMLPAFEDG